MEGFAGFRWKGGRAPWVVRAAIADAIERAAKHLKTAIRRNIKEPYPPASAPGEYPHKRTGNLRRSIDIWVNRKTLEGYVGPTEDAPYGIFLEYGTRKMDARPFLMPTLRLEQTRIRNTIQRAAKRAWNKYARGEFR